MSAIAIATIAAAGATFVFLERYRVRRDAARRCVERRCRGVVQWAQLVRAHQPTAVDPPARTLVASLERAVLAGDEVCSFEDRLFSGGGGESPFRFRRSRVDGAQRRFGVALERVRRDADVWLDASGVGEPALARHAIRRVVEFIAGEPAPSTRYVDPAIDALENALANLYRPPQSGASPHPFR